MPMGMPMGYGMPMGMPMMTQPTYSMPVQQMPVQPMPVQQMPVQTYTMPVQQMPVTTMHTINETQVRTLSARQAFDKRVACAHIGGLPNETYGDGRPVGVVKSAHCAQTGYTAVS